jgi:hypothetical protein
MVIVYYYYKKKKKKKSFQLHVVLYVLYFIPTHLLGREVCPYLLCHHILYVLYVIVYVIMCALTRSNV